MELKNKNVFVTGSTRGIGLAVAHKFASLGANVVLNGRSEISEDLLAQFADYGVTVVGLMGNIGQANYAASKAGLIGFTKSVAREVAARGVRVNAIAPGFIESDMTDAIPEKMKDAMIAQVPMKRIGQAEEVAEVAAFLASQEYLTGQTIAIDGGMTMQ